MTAEEKLAIEEMAKVIETTEQIARDAHCGLPSPRMYAKDLYWKGYRKQSEGEWVVKPNILGEEAYFCSLCDYDWLTAYGKPHLNRMYFCPNCGAKMKGGAE